MKQVPKIDKDIGLLTYANYITKNTGYRIKLYKDDFIVIEELQPTNYITCDTEQGAIATLIKVSKPWMKDTFMIIRIIARRLGISSKRIRPLGLKDSKAYAVQHILIRGHIDNRDIDKIKVFNPEIVGYVSQRFIDKLTYLNHFYIKVYKDDKSDKYLDSLSGFLDENIEIPNFYGYQRFGQLRYINHKIGRYIIHSQYKEAVLTFLTQSSRYEDPEVYKWRKELAKGKKFETALKEAPPKLDYEKRILKYLIRYKEDYKKALKAFPKRLLKLLIQSYQSYLYNLMLSHRLMEGLPISSSIEGDFIINSGKITRTIDKTKYPPAIPLIGYAYRPSKGPQGEIEKKILNELRIDSKDFYLQDFPELSLKGGFRPAKQELYMLLLKEHPSHITVETVLSKGCYCTILLRELFKPIDPVRQGF
jgi:tRNA pseudouridine13 synthase